MGHYQLLLPAFCTIWVGTAGILHTSHKSSTLTHIELYRFNTGLFQAMKCCHTSTNSFFFFFKHTFISGEWTHWNSGAGPASGHTSDFFFFQVSHTTAPHHFLFFFFLLLHIVFFASPRQSPSSPLFLFCEPLLLVCLSCLFSPPPFSSFFIIFLAKRPFLVSSLVGHFFSA